VNRLASILDAEDVLVDVIAATPLRLFAQAAEVFARHPSIGKTSVVTETLIERERLASTCLGHGVAIPHGRLKGLRSTVAVVMRVREPLHFGGPDDEPVSLFVFLLVPEMATQRDLEILGEIAEMLSEKDVRERLKHEDDAGTVYATITGWVPRGATAERR
jgi:nitrogen PTS system EIIA component